MMPLIVATAILSSGAFAQEAQPTSDQAFSTPHCANPILPGYFADPSILQDGGKVYVYATLDPWGDKTLGCWESSDFKNWTYRVINWPTKQACTSKTSRAAGVWAPSVVRGPEGKFHMAISVGSEVWVGVADHPLGPWRNPLGDRPIIPSDFKPGFHMIDAELFVDDNGQAYLYWGSGLNWVNGHCFVVKLKPDFATFDGEVHDVTPPHYFEGPFMAKRDGHYFLMYSAGNTIRDTYQVHYAVGNSPLGPFTEPDGHLILATNKDTKIISPGHHAVFNRDGRDYIFYHRQSIPFDPKFIGRQVCVDELHFKKDGRIETVAPTHSGPSLTKGDRAEASNLAASGIVTASSQATPYNAPSCVLDDNYATRWAAAREANGAWIQLDLKTQQKITRQFIRPEYAWKSYRFTAEASTDGTHWQTLADFTKQPAIGSPIEVQQPVSARYLRLVFPEDIKGSSISLFEWSVQ